MSLSLVGVMTRLTRTSVLATLEEDYVRTAIGKGLPRRRILTHHVIKPSLIPVVTTAGLLFVAVTGGVVVIEYVFSIPGLGRLILESINLPRLSPDSRGGSADRGARHHGVGHRRHHPPHSRPSHPLDVIVQKEITRVHTHHRRNQGNRSRDRRTVCLARQPSLP